MELEAVLLRPDPRLRCRVLVRPALDTRSDDQAERQSRDRPSCMRLAGRALQAAGPDTKTIRPHREQPTRAGALAVRA